MIFILLSYIYEFNVSSIYQNESRKQYFVNTLSNILSAVNIVYFAYHYMDYLLELYNRAFEYATSFDEVIFDKSERQLDLIVFT